MLCSSRVLNLWLNERLEGMMEIVSSEWSDNKGYDKKMIASATRGAKGKDKMKTTK